MESTFEPTQLPRIRDASTGPVRSFKWKPALRGPGGMAGEAPTAATGKIDKISLSLRLFNCS